MKYKCTDREYLLKEIPHIINYLETIDSRLSNVELVIRDSDHMWHSLRLESEGELSSNLYEEICNYTETHCCICGSNYRVHRKDVGFYDCKMNYDHQMYGDPPFYINVCINCFEKLYGNMVDANTLVKFQIKRHTEEGKNYNAPHKKIRLLTADGHIVYRFLKQIYAEDDKYFITPRSLESQNTASTSACDFHNLKEPVTILGVDTGKRDINDERIFTGDVLLVKHKLFDRKWLAEMIGSPRGIKGQDDNTYYWGLYDGHNFPSPFSEFSSVEIVGYLSNESIFEWQKKNINIVNAILLQR